MTKSADKELLRASFKLEYPYERSPGPVIGKFLKNYLMRFWLALKTLRVKFCASS